MFTAKEEIKIIKENIKNGFMTKEEVRKNINIEKSLSGQVEKIKSIVELCELNAFSIKGYVDNLHDSELLREYKSNYRELLKLKKEVIK